MRSLPSSFGTHKETTTGAGDRIATKKPASRKPAAKKQQEAPAEESQPKQLAQAPTYDAAKTYRVTCHDRVVYATGAAVDKLVIDFQRLYDLPVMVAEA